MQAILSMYGKCVTHAKVFPQSLALKQQRRNMRDIEEVGTKRGVNMERSTAGTKKKKSRRLAIARGHLPPGEGTKGILVWVSGTG